MDWNRLLYAGAGLVLLTGLVLHQGDVPQPGGDDTSLLSGTAVRVPVAQAAQGQNPDPEGQAEECAEIADADTAGSACSESRDEKRLAQNDPPE